MSRGVHAFWFPPLFLDARLLWALSLFKDWVYFGCLSLSFSFFSSVSIIQFATISMVRVVMDIFINQSASKLFMDFLLCVLLKSGTRGFFVLARVCSYCAGVNKYLTAILRVILSAILTAILRVILSAILTANWGGV